MCPVRTEFPGWLCGADTIAIMPASQMGKPRHRMQGALLQSHRQGKCGLGGGLMLLFSDFRENLVLVST